MKRTPVGHPEEQAKETHMFLENSPHAGGLLRPRREKTNVFTITITKRSCCRQLEDDGRLSFHGVVPFTQEGFQNVKRDQIKSTK